MSEHGKGYVRGTGPTPTTPPPPKPKPGDPHPGPAAGILDDMTDTVSVPRDDLAHVLDLVGDLDTSAVLLRALLAPPQPTLRDALARAACYDPQCPPDAGCCLSCDAAADRILPVVEAAVSAAADEAWNAALTRMRTWMATSRAAEAEAALRRPTEGSAP